MKTIFDLLAIDLKSLPNESCIETGTRTSPSGDQITDYSLVLEKPELGLFKIVTILQFTNGTKNIGLSNPNLESISIPALEKLVNNLYSLYGDDSNSPPRGLFTAEDQRSVHNLISDPSDGFWMGRMWNFQNMAIRLDLDDEKLCLFIHGVPGS